MSITDIVTGRMAPRRPFGQRQGLMPALPPKLRLPSPFLQAWRAYLLELWIVIPAFWRRAAFSLAYWQALAELGRPALPGMPQARQLGRRPLTVLVIPGRLIWQGLKFRARPRPKKTRRSLKAAFLALVCSDFSTTLVRLIAYLGGLTMLAIMAMHMSRAIPSPVRGDPEPQSKWVQVAKPFPAFSIAMPELAEGGQDYSLQRHKAGGGRRDILSWGEPKGSAPHLLVEIYRPLAEAVAFDSPEREIAARLADIDAGALHVAGYMETKFGPVALVEFSLGPARQCLGFVRTHKEPQLQILGWHCIGGTATMEREITACALDRLSLVSAGSDPKLREFFARAELKRNFCGQRSHIMTPTPKLGPAAAPAPDLKRGRLAAG